MRKAINALMKVISIIIGLLLCIAVITVFVQIIWRYVLKTPLGWSDQFCRFLYVWIVMLGLPVLFHEKSVTAFDYLSNKLSPKQQNVLHIVVSLLSMFFAAAFFYFSIMFIQKKGGQMIPAFKTVPYKVIYNSMPVGAALIFVEMLLQFVESLKNMSNKKEEE